MSFSANSCSPVARSTATAAELAVETCGTRSAFARRLPASSRRGRPRRPARRRPGRREPREAPRSDASPDFRRARVPSQAMGLDVDQDGPRGPFPAFTTSSIIPLGGHRVPQTSAHGHRRHPRSSRCPEPAASKPFLERVDATLTDGYAHALQLEARALAHRAADRRGRRRPRRRTPTPDHEPELVALAERLRSANAEHRRAARAAHVAARPPRRAPQRRGVTRAQTIPLRTA